METNPKETNRANAEPSGVQGSPPGTASESTQGSAPGFGAGPAKEAVWHALSLILDPEYGIPITDLGLVYDVVVEGGEVSVALTLTTPACPAGQVILDGARHAVASLPGVSASQVFLVWDPPWSPEFLSEAAREKLGGR